MTVSSYRFYTERSISFYPAAGKIYSLGPEAQTYTHTHTQSENKSKLANLSEGICCSGVQPAGKHTCAASPSINHTNSQIDTHTAYCSCRCSIVIEALISSLYLLCLQCSASAFCNINKNRFMNRHCKMTQCKIKYIFLTCAMAFCFFSLFHSVHKQKM